MITTFVVVVVVVVVIVVVVLKDSVGFLIYVDELVSCWWMCLVF